MLLGGSHTALMAVEKIAMDSQSGNIIGGKDFSLIGEARVSCE